MKFDKIQQTEYAVDVFAYSQWPDVLTGHTFWYYSLSLEFQIMGIHKTIELVHDYLQVYLS